MHGLVASGSRFLAWRPASLEPAGPVQTRGAKFGFGFGSRPLVSYRTLIALLFSYVFLHPSRPGGCKVWLGMARGFLLGGLQP